MGLSIAEELEDYDVIEHKRQPVGTSDLNQGLPQPMKEPAHA
jgi:hypothetical protein